jgi:hypothetical protein
MNNKIEEALWNDYNDAKSQLEGLALDDKKAEVLLKERDNIRNELIEYDKSVREVDLKRQLSVEDSKIKSMQLTTDQKNELMRNAITIGTFLVSTTVSIITIVKTFEFDRDSSVTSTMGRGVLNGVVPKLFKH